MSSMPFSVQCPASSSAACKRHQYIPIILPNSNHLAAINQNLTLTQTDLIFQTNGHDNK